MSGPQTGRPTSATSTRGDIRITAACHMRGTRYSLFMNGLKNSGILLNRKMLSQIAIDDPKAFDQIVEIAVKASVATPAKAAA